jgi:hypothetical protein
MIIIVVTTIIANVPVRWVTLRIREVLGSSIERRQAIPTEAFVTFLDSSMQMPGLTSVKSPPYPSAFISVHCTLIITSFQTTQSQKCLFVNHQYDTKSPRLRGTLVPKGKLRKILGSLKGATHQRLCSERNLKSRVEKHGN